MVASGRLTRGRFGFLLRAVVAAYVIALATLPFGHHDLLCHLKSSTHCTTCLVGTSAEDSHALPSVAAAPLIEAGRAYQLDQSFTAFSLPAARAGRAPPTAHDLSV